MGNFKDFANRLRPQSPYDNLPIVEDKLWGLRVGYMVRMTLGPITRTYWYTNLGTAYRAHLKFEAKKRWPLRKTYRHQTTLPV